MSELPSWYSMALQSLATGSRYRPVSGPSRSPKVYGTLDVAVTAGHTELVASVGPAALAYAARGLQRFRRRNSVPLLEPEDVTAMLLVNLAKKCAGTNTRILGPALLQRPILDDMDPVTLVWVSLASVVWRGRRSPKTAQPTAGLLVIKSEGTILKACHFNDDSSSAA